MSTAKKIDLTKEKSDLMYDTFKKLNPGTIGKNWKEVSKLVPVKKEELTLLIKLANSSKNSNEFYNYVTDKESFRIKLSPAEMESAKGGRISLCAYLMAAGMDMDRAIALTGYGNY